jgi:hypothetical protein
MDDELDRAARYRRKAEDLRTNASDDRDHLTRDQLLDLAEMYERLAEAVERIHRTNRSREQGPR